MADGKAQVATFWGLSNVCSWNSLPLMITQRITQHIQMCAGQLRI